MIRANTERQSSNRALTTSYRYKSQPFRCGECSLLFDCPGLLYPLFTLSGLLCHKLFPDCRRTAQLSTGMGGMFSAERRGGSGLRRNSGERKKEYVPGGETSRIGNARLGRFGETSAYSSSAVSVGAACLGLCHAGAFSA